MCGSGKSARIAFYPLFYVPINVELYVFEIVSLHVNKFNHKYVYNTKGNHRFVSIYIILHGSSVLLGLIYIFFLVFHCQSSQLDMIKVSGKVSGMALFGKFEKIYIEILKVDY